MASFLDLAIEKVRGHKPDHAVGEGDGRFEGRNVVFAMFLHFEQLSSLRAECVFQSSACGWGGVE